MILQRVCNHYLFIFEIFLILALMLPYKINDDKAEIILPNMSFTKDITMNENWNIRFAESSTDTTPVEIDNTNLTKTCIDLATSKILSSEMPFVTSMNTLEDNWSFPYSWGEITWGIILLIGIFIVNIWILSVVGRSRELWKPRHLWMACLCITDLFVGTHKLLDLLLLIIPWQRHGFCVLQKTTLGIPYVVNMLLLTLLSLDRFIAVRYPFFYSSSISNKHVAIGFFIVILTGLSLAGASVFLGIRDPICRAQNLQLIYLTVVLTICSTLTLLFNSAVLRIAKRQLNAIYAQEPALGGRRVSVVCGKCGFKNDTFVNTLVPISMKITTNPLDNVLNSNGTATLVPLTDAVVMRPLDMDLNHSSGTNDVQLNINIDLDSPQLHHDIESCIMDDTMTPLVRTVSLPTIPDSISVPISIVVQPDSSLPSSDIIGNVHIELDMACKMTSMSHLDTIPSSQVNHNNLPRSRSLVSCRTHKIIQPVIPRLQLFRNLHFARAHMFHMRRLFPSIRFARTVLLIMIPMWVFILPIVTIIPLHRSCEDRVNSDFNCNIVDTLWRYLLVHMRSVLPLQAILDTMIYAFGSKEFRQAVKKLMYKQKGRRK